MFASESFFGRESDELADRILNHRDEDNEVPSEFFGRPTLNAPRNQLQPIARAAIGEMMRGRATIEGPPAGELETELATSGLELVGRFRHRVDDPAKGRVEGAFEGFPLGRPVDSETDEFLPPIVLLKPDDVVPLRPRR